MANIDHIKEYMEQNTDSLSIKKVEEIRKRFNISSSKFYRDFKSEVQCTPRDLLIRMKIELAHHYKLGDPALTIKEIVSKIGWDLTERQFADLFKVRYGMTFGGKPLEMRNFPKWSNQQEETSHQNEFLFSSDRKDLEEIIFRMVLLTGAYTVTNDGPLCKTVKYDMENTCFRLPMFAFEKEVIFRLFFNHNNHECLDLFAFFTRNGEEDYCFVPNDKDAYLNLIYNVAIKQEEKVKKEILDSISNWEEMAVEQERFIFLDYEQQTYNSNIRPQINRAAGIFAQSQKLYDSISSDFKDEYENLLKGMCLREKELSAYLRAVETEDEHLIKSTLKVLCEIGDEELSSQKLDLLLRLAEYPDMEFIDIADYSFGMDEDLIAKVLRSCLKEAIPQLVCDYFRAYKEMMEGDEDDDDYYYGNLLLADILDDYLMEGT